ncbi:MAG: MFS transporter [Pseudomonadota bacterium]
MRDTSRTRRPWLGLTFLLVGILLVVADQTITAVLLPSIDHDLEIGLDLASLSITVFMIAAAATLAPLGQIADVIGRRNMLAIALVGFAVSSAITGSAPDIVWLMVGRALQGIVFAAIAPSTLALLNANFPEGHERNLAFSLWATASAVAVAVGPLIGAAFAEFASWRDVFYVSIPLCIGAAAGVLRFFANDRPENVTPAFDWPGMVLLATGMGALVFAFQEGPSLGWVRPADGTTLTIAGLSPIPLLFVVGLLFLIVVTQVERKRGRAGRAVLMRHDLLTVPSFRKTMLASAAMSMALYAMVIFIAIYVQFVLDLDALTAGAVLTVLGVALAAGGMSASALLRSIRRRYVVSLAIAAQAVVLIAMAVIVGYSPPLVVLGLLVLPFGAAYAMAFSGMMAQLLIDVPEPLAARASGISAMVRLGLDALATAIIVGAFIGIAVGEVQPTLDDTPSLTADERDAIEAATHFRIGVGVGRDEAQHVIARLSRSPETAVLVVDLRTGFSDAARTVLLIAFVFVAIGLALYLFLPSGDRKNGKAAMS